MASLPDSFVPFLGMFYFDGVSKRYYIATSTFTNNLGIYGFAL